MTPALHERYSVSMLNESFVRSRRINLHRPSPAIQQGTVQPVATIMLIYLKAANI